MDTSRFTTAFDAFRATARAHPRNAFLCVPAMAGRDYHPGGYEISYGAALAEIEALAAGYRAVGYGHGHRVALMLDNRPEHVLHFLALNSLGASMVPVNADYLHHELAYLLEHSEADLAVVREKHRVRIEKVAAQRKQPLSVMVAGPDGGIGSVPRALTPASPAPLARSTEADIMYTSGTTGRPKGCIHDNEYLLLAGRSYATFGGRMSVEHGRERLINPLPLFHVNSGGISLMAMIVTAGCLVVPDRFHPSSWWREVAETRATIMHYLGIMPPILLKLPPSEDERRHRVKFGLGAGIDPAIHHASEQRFGMPLVEVWGMTETASRLFADAFEPRRIDSRAFGRPGGELEAKVVDERGDEAPRGMPGELLVRAAGADPRHGFFRGYLKNEAATEEAWRGGWFHTGDVATQGEDGMLYFVERRKNIIRRSGENISAAEVENALVELPQVAKVAALAVPDELREEEVMAAIVLGPGVAASRETAAAIVSAAREKLAYFKLPGWIAFVADLPITSTQKVQKGLIFGEGADPRLHERAFDLRDMKKRGA